MSLALVGAALIGAGATYYASESAGDAQQDSIRSAERLSGAGLAAQNAASRQQLELARPLIETRDASLRALQTLFGLPVSRPSDPLGSSGAGSNGSRLIALNGLSTVGQHSRQTNSTLTDMIAPPALRNEGIVGAASVRDGAGGAPSLFYDPGAHAIVDANGALVYNVPNQPGVIEGLRSGFNNQVRIDEQGNLFSVGSSGERPINIQLARQSPEEAAEFIGGSATNPAADRNAMVSMLMDTPGIKFVDDQGRRELEQMFAARGLRRSGAAFEAGLDRSTNLAQTNYRNLVLNPLFELAGFGQRGADSASDTLGRAGDNASANQSTLAGLALQSGNARASSFDRAGQIGSNLADTLAGLYEANRGAPTKPGLGQTPADISKGGVNPLASLYIDRDPIQLRDYAYGD